MARRMTFKKSTVQITLSTLRDWVREGVEKILYDIEREDSFLDQDYFTASDLEAYVRLKADTEAKETQRRIDEVGSWWGYNGWVRIRVVDGYPGGLLGNVRSVLQIQSWGLEAHNFGRGHCSGLRLKRAGTGLSEAETKTVEKKTKEKPVHLPTEGDYFSRKALCVAGRKTRGSGFTRIKHRSTRFSSKPEEITCPRCRKLLAERTA